MEIDLPVAPFCEEIPFKRASSRSKGPPGAILETINTAKVIPNMVGKINRTLFRKYFFKKILWTQLFAHSRLLQSVFSD